MGSAESPTHAFRVAVSQGNCPLAYNAAKGSTYCKERWDQSSSHVEALIQAAPVLRRRAQVGDSPTSATKARTVASLPEAVQDAILPLRD